MHKFLLVLLIGAGSLGLAGCHKAPARPTLDQFQRDPELLKLWSKKCQDNDLSELAEADRGPVCNDVVNANIHALLKVQANGFQNQMNDNAKSGAK